MRESYVPSYDGAYRTSVFRVIPYGRTETTLRFVSSSLFVPTLIGTTRTTPRRAAARRAAMCLCFPPWFCAACCGWRGVNTIGPPRDAGAIARRRERRETRGRCCLGAAPRHPTMEGRAGGEVEMTPGEGAGLAETSASVAEASTPPSVPAKRTVRVPAASERPLGGSGSGDATEPETPLAGDEELGDDDDDEARSTAGFRALPLVAKDPRDPRDPNSPRKYGLGKSRRPKKGAPASTAGGALSTRDVDVDGVQSTESSTFEGSTPP